MITAVVCSDDRMQYIGKYICDISELITIDETTDFLSLPTLDILILPVKGIDEQGYITIHNTLVKIPSLFWTMQKDALLVTGMRCVFLERLPNKSYYFLEDQQVVNENAILTAEGVLQMMITSNDKSLYDIDVDIIGYGNCGKAIFDMLSNLQVRVRAIRRVCEKSHQFTSIENWKQCGDIIINTSIQPVLCAGRMEDWDKKPIIIDIATPDVIDLKAAKRLHIQVIKAGNLPAKFCPDSAGKIIARYVRGIVNER